MPHFELDQVPEDLHNLIPNCKGFVKVKLPCPHKPQKTTWLPRETAEHKLFKHVQGFSDLLAPKAYRSYMVFQEEQAKWLSGEEERPQMRAISNGDFVEWARGVVLDLRRLKEGVVTELDYTAPTPSRFDALVIQAAFTH